MGIILEGEDMKAKKVRILTTGTILLLLLLISPAVNASLTVIGTAVYNGPEKLYNGKEFNLIYEDDSIYGGLVWLDFTNPYCQTWNYQMNWATNVIGSRLTVELFDGYTTDIDWSTGWRLPSSGDDPGYGYNDTTSELGHLYYVSLGNTSGLGSVDTGPFENLHTRPNGSGYWTETTYEASNGTIYSYSFLFSSGYQMYASQSGQFYAAAVHPGTVSFAPVPVPAAMWLLGSGLLGLMGIRRRKRSRTL